MEYESGDEIFITQNTFQNNVNDSYDTDNALDDALSIMNSDVFSDDRKKLNNEDIPNFSNEAFGITNENDSNNNDVHEYPNFSDISDDELIACTQQVELEECKKHR